MKDLQGDPMADSILRTVRNAIRHPYAWPGGYPVYTVLADGALLCRECARRNYRRIADDTRNQDDGWRALGAMILYETEQPEYCGDCNNELESAYGIVHNHDCPDCYGNGDVYLDGQYGDGPLVTCRTCLGSGVIHTNGDETQ